MVLTAKRGRGAPSTLLIAAAMVAAALPTAAATAAPSDKARPALWVVKDADTTIYLFGTFHTLNSDRDWLTKKIDKAFARSRELVLETVVPKNPADMAAAAPEARGSAYLKGEAKVMEGGRAKGMSTATGADQVLRDMAEAGGKPVSGLEDFGQQLQTLARIRAAPIPASALAAPAPVQDVTLEGLLAAWRNGDVGAFAAMLAGFKAKSPDAYETLIAKRNREWAGWVHRRLAVPGVVFVAVGSGHLSGADSVQVRLAEQGVRVRRID